MTTYKVALERFNSIHSLIRANDSRGLNKAFTGSEQSSITAKKRFSGTESYDEAVDLLAHGWSEPMSKLSGALNGTVKINTQAEKRRPSTGIVGYAPSVPNAIIGLPNSMITTETVRTKVKAVTIIYAQSVSCGWGTDEILESGIAMLNIVNMLELQGVRVRLTIEAISTINSKDLSILLVDIKDWREAIDLKKIAFPVAHSSMLRRIAFRWLETFENITNRGYTRGYGTPLSNNSYETAVEILKAHNVLKDEEYYINAMLCKECNYDTNAIMERAGMKKFKELEK